MNKKFLQDLVGMSLSEAEVKIALAGLSVEVYAEGDIITLLARPNTVLLYHDDDEVVVHAAAGDPLELK